MLRNKRYCTVLLLSATVAALLIASGFITDKVVDTVTHDRLFCKRSCVVIDAGHGGVDGGAISCTGVYESQINLDIALRLNDLLHLLGIDTVMIRTEDISIYTQGNTIAAKKVSDLKERVRIVNSTEGCILISIHQNYFSDAKYSGAQVFYKNDDTLAKALQEEFVRTVNISSNRKAKKAQGIYLMDNVCCTAALIECGFLSNPQEEQLLRTAQYQKKICSVIAATVSRYLHNRSVA